MSTAAGDPILTPRRMTRAERLRQLIHDERCAVEVSTMGEAAAIHNAAVSILEGLLALVDPELDDGQRAPRRPPGWGQ